MQEMVEDEEYRVHPLAAGALRHLADNHWKNKETAKAVASWKQIVADFGGTNRKEVYAARTRLITYYIKNRDYAGYENWLVNADNREKPKFRKQIVEQVMHVARHRIFAWHLKVYGQFEKDARAAAAKACFEYLQSRKAWFDKADSTWQYYDHAISFLAHYHRDKKTRDRHIDEAVAIVRKNPDQERRHQLYSWLVDRLREAGDYPRAQYVIGLIADPPLASYKGYELLAAQYKWQAAATRLETIEKMGNAAWAERALTERANVYRERLGRYEDAIKLYHQLNKPPWTLWQIQDCYKRWGKLEDAITTLSEIENSFPDEAPKAAWYKASYYHEAKMAKKAIAQARKILKAYKKSSESSLAHQLLETYGIKTGGGVFDED
jgi:tetratricopeptide (TPR) repeat protein